MEFFTISMLNGLSYGLLLFMLSSGLTLIFSMMGVLNFAHASFYMIGAYVAYSIARFIGFWPALVIAPIVVGVLGALFERFFLRRVHKYGHVPELLALQRTVVRRGTPAEVMTPAVLEETFRAPMEVLEHLGMPVVLDGPRVRELSA